MQMPHSTLTTTLKVCKPENYNALSRAYQLVRYELPPDLRGRLKNVPYMYGQVHNILRDQLDCPYKTYLHDQLDPDTTKWVVYALYLPCDSPKSLEMPLSARTSLLAPQSATFEQLPLHILLKLLEITYVCGHRVTRFVGQDACYIHAKKVGEFSHICLRIDLKGSIRTEATDKEQEFKVNGRACLFRKVDYPKGGSHPSYTYFGRKITEKRVHFLHLKRKEIEAAKLKNEPVYGITTREGKRTTLAYHNLRNIEGSTGKILADFIHDFVAFLAKYDIHCQSKKRDFMRFTPPKNIGQLPLELLETVEVYDHRMNRTLELDAYLHVLSQLFPTIQFVGLTDITQWKKHAVLVLQDYHKGDFYDGKPLAGKVDPYDSLYNATPHIPKQSMNVNMRKETEAEDDVEDDFEEIDDEEGDDDTGKDPSDYFSYDLPTIDDKNFKRNTEVALHQLYLKECICLGRSFMQRLPLLPQQVLFVRKARTVAGHDPYQTALLLEGEMLSFLDLRDPDQRARLREICTRFEVDWVRMEDQLLRKYRKRTDEEPDQELTHYDLIIGPNLFVELEDAEERVLYDYQTIVERLEAKKKPFPTQHFKLLSFYDRIRPKTFLSSEELQNRRLLQGDAAPQKEELESLTLYRQLAMYDAFLDDEVQPFYPTIPLLTLTSDQFKDQINHIFQKEQRSRTQLKKYYQRRGIFLSEKAKEVHMYEGIWYDEEHHYMVGSTQPLKEQQPRAHLIRHFDVYQGKGLFDIQPFLLMMSVQFVRHNQYTVYPYPFHLIDLYVENILRYL